MKRKQLWVEVTRLTFRLRLFIFWHFLQRRAGTLKCALEEVSKLDFDLLCKQKFSSKQMDTECQHCACERKSFQKE